MSTVRKILDHKGTHVFTIPPDATALEAAMLMNEHRIGALVVVGEDGPRGPIRGMFTERDMLRRVVAGREDPATAKVKDVMTTTVYTCGANTPVDDARALIMAKRIRHLPVVDERSGALLGMISIGDLNAWELNGQEVQIKYLEEYIYGHAPDAMSANGI